MKNTRISLMVGILLVGAGLATLGGNCDVRVNVDSSGLSVDFNPQRDFEDFFDDLFD